ncbi:NAD(P)/FAD-dependent oxidoreductase [Vulcanococcus limneticus Candia 3F8]|uniref:NAD(P)/FAD-dependent oxidoreductase n=1 Tax=Vulcanococcus limneticus TaxID=2170428 RepID=UPI000B9897ED|nr:NAD(P)/FAD-dependent oxidoreductase [Vulcanococcus limneticus]MCP9792325.1 NAD(P)/FAD-dependent oxidoreductase [Vulcanococcus limneticus MW73D5]MCP9893830.1 NAD(P)/FAD-dependent oxidoreductase [Vulcanococcus limneticus Candia 3F8]MCP9897674.1 NAD(P)/FAD-dependent oxidoreductase [Vulcanococcus limneticus Candia 3B3]
MLIAGCGPAGAELARLLARRGVDVLVVEALPDLARAAFSSAALPLAALERFEIPAEVVAHRWTGWRLLGPGPADRHWRASDGRPLGAVLDFAALRRWLAGQAQGFGAQIALGWRALAVQQPGGMVRTRLRGPGGEECWLTSRWVVDATGQQRGLLGDPPASCSDPLVSGLGAEWLLEIPLERWRPWSDQLTFLMGSDWMPQGYGWVFPMQPGQLKLGVCRLNDDAGATAGPPLAGRRQQPPLGPWLEATLARTGLAGARVLDRHGGLIRSTVRRREPHQRGQLIGLGDAVSTANLLGGEGIRHAMASARVLASVLLQALNGEPERLRTYPGRLRRELGWRWGLSGRLARRTWLGLEGPRADRRLERLLMGLEQQHSAEDLSALLFDYRFERYGLRALPYLLGWRR